MTSEPDTPERPRRPVPDTLSGLAASLKPHPKGFLAALEGLDGSGKSTQARRLAEALKATGFAVSLFREPSDGEWGRAVREGAAAGVRRAPLKELALFMKDRAWDVAANILPALEADGTVVMDRYVLSTVSYQGALGLPPHLILRRNTVFPWPDLTVVLDLDPAEGLARIRAGRERTDLAFENAPYLAKVNDVLKLACGLPGVEFIDARAPADELAETIAGLVVTAARKKAYGTK